MTTELLNRIPAVFAAPVSVSSPLAISLEVTADGPAADVARKLLQEQPARRPGQQIAFIYCRCSSDPNGRGKSVERQVEDCWADCQRQGFWVAGIFIDNDRSASSYATKDREEYDRMTGLMPGTAVNVLVCWEASRATRDLRTYLDLSDLSRSLGIKWCFNGSMFDLDNEDDEFRAVLDVGLNQREVRKLSRRVKVGIAKAARMGLPHGGPPPYGYYRRYHEETREFLGQYIDDRPCAIPGVINEDGSAVMYTRAEIVREIFDRIAAGEKRHTLAKSLNQRGIPAPEGGKWIGRRVHGIAINASYIGWRVHNKVLVRPGIWARLVEEDATWDAVQAKVGEAVETRREVNKKAGVPTSRRGPSEVRHTRPSNARNLLSYIAKCGVCGGLLGIGRGGGRNERSQSYKTYICRGVEEGSKAGCVSIRCEKLDAYVESVIIARMADPATLDWLIRPDDSGASALAERAAALRMKLNQWKEKAKTGDMDPDEYEEITASLRRQISDLEAKAAPVHIPLAVRTMIGEQAAQVWDGLSLTAKRDVISSIMEVELWKGLPGGRNFDPSRVAFTWLLDNGRRTKTAQA